VLVRPLDPGERDLAEALGRLTLDAYREHFPDIDDDPYGDELQDVATRAEVAVVLVALDDERLLGGVTYVPAGNNPMREHDLDDVPSIRMLAVATAARGMGAGEALTVACVERARAEGSIEIVLHSSTTMTTAHRLYQRVGFRRAEELDWQPEPDLLLMGFRMRL
jgi:ribosomal protein S18 acetylase RimI-like enzyme